MTDIICVILTGLCTYLVWFMQNHEKNKKNGDKAMMILMRRELRELHDKHMKEGHISPHQLGEFEEIYDVYHALGGNGTGTVWKEDVEKLERK